MKNTVNLNSINLVNADSLQFIKTLPDNSIDLIATDPPYYRVKNCAWDRQWESVSDYLAWLDEYLAEFWRVLKPAGSLYLFCGSRLASDTELLVRQRMNVLNHIIWAKPSGPWKRQNKESLRQYFPATERIIFAEHYGAEGFAKGQAGYASKCAELKGQVLAPLIEYFANAREQLGISAKEINAATGSQMCSHWFSRSQWQLPNREQYERLQELFSEKAAAARVSSPLRTSHTGLVEEFDALDRDYRELRMQYDDLRQQYEHLRRPFSVSVEVPYTDVWQFPPVASYPGKHPCEKPAALMEHIIIASSRPGDVVADFFMGSGATLKAAVKHGRSAIGVELEEERFIQTQEEINRLT
ncbi:DNA adenine methylase [Erwinia typographi]|uniref:Methyltransferase n=1 Tax=Erwinia typographi TaxID=371042 RepID=A0A0A3YKA0_9GAMM|nr:site-specific DNA-methyltransferase [Erwinia typographi]KGT87227.1 DNA adenine methylase [Erwinia typographi]